MIVLLQTGKGATLGAAFGGASQTVFGSRGPAGFLSKITTIAAVIFMLTSLTLAIYSGKPKITAVPKTVTTETKPAPAPAKKEPAEVEKSKDSQAGQPVTGQQPEKPAETKKQER